MQDADRKNPAKAPNGRLFRSTVIALVSLWALLRWGFPYLAQAIAGSENPLPLPETLFAVFMVLAGIGTAILVSLHDKRIEEWKRPLSDLARGAVPKGPWRPFSTGILAALLLLVLTGGALTGVSRGLLIALFSLLVALAVQTPQPAHAWLRRAVFVVLPMMVGWEIYAGSIPRARTPTALRIQHPAAPQSFENLENPFRGAPAERLEKALEEGRVLFQKNCRVCHGSKADGAGPMARALRLKPADFRDPGTIATVTESYAFWRIKKGWTGLPLMATPWNSAMPAWEEELTDEEIWKIILAEYWTAGVEPRIPEKLEGALPQEPRELSQRAKPLRAAGESPAPGKVVYQERCVYCHGEKGDGNGPIADYLYPRPRDFTLGIFKFRSTRTGEPPLDSDLFRTVSKGIPGTSMPEWETVLSESERREVVRYIKAFGADFMEGAPTHEVVAGKEPAVTAEGLAQGAALYKRMKCAECHGDRGRGDGTSSKKLQDDWGFVVTPFNLAEAWKFRGGRRARDIYMRFTTGINGTPMPSFEESLGEEERWRLAQFILSLTREEEAGNDVVLVSNPFTGELPLDPGHPAWRQARPLAVPLAGQVLARPRWQNHSIHTIYVRSLYNEGEIAFRLEWDDRTKDTMHDGSAADMDTLLADTYVPAEHLLKAKNLRDAVALQFPVKHYAGPQLPHFFRGQPDNRVNLWVWHADRAEAGGGEREAVLEMNGAGFKAPLQLQADSAQRVLSRSRWGHGTWSVVMKRSLQNADANDAQFETGRLIPFALQAWDGGKGETGRIMSLSAWSYVTLKTGDRGSGALFGLLGAALAGLLEFAWVWLHLRRGKIPAAG